MLSFVVFVASLGISLGVALPKMPVGGNLNDLPSKTVNQFPYPSHAMCTTKWTFGMDCIETSINLINEIKEGSEACAKNHDDNQTCPGTYQFIIGDEYSISATHTSTDGQNVDVLAIYLTPQSYGCFVTSYSFTMDEIEVLDNGRNYCNVWNLVQASGLDTVPKFSRDTSNQKCTQFTTADCSIY